MRKDNRWCLICNPKNRTIYWRFEEDDETIRGCWCNKCNRYYKIDEYCDLAGIDRDEFLKNSEDFVKFEALSNEVNVLSWPKNFIPLSDPRATKGLEYIKGRSILPDGDMYYDLDQEGIVFPYYYHNHFVGAQVRFLESRIDDDGEEHKITTLYGTRLGMLFYGWNQVKFIAQVKRVVVTEGAFNALCLQQAFNRAYGGVSSHPWKFIALSGSGVSSHQAEVLRELKEQGYQIIAAPDTDDAGFAMSAKLKEEGAITHYAFTHDTENDWNDMAQTMENKDFVVWFLRQIRDVEN